MNGFWHNVAVSCALLALSSKAPVLAGSSDNTLISFLVNARAQHQLGRCVSLQMIQWGFGHCSWIKAFCSELLFVQLDFSGILCGRTAKWKQFTNICQHGVNKSDAGAARFVKRRPLSPHDPRLFSELYLHLPSGHTRAENDACDCFCQCWDFFCQAPDAQSSVFPLRFINILIKA